MAEEPSKPEAEPFDATRRESKRAQWALNILVVFSAIAGSVFFLYVLHTIGPFNSKGAENVDVPVSSAGAKFGLLVGEDSTSGIAVSLRDIDDAPDYRDKLSDTMRGDLGIEQAGRLYLLVISNDGASRVNVSGGELQVVDKKGTSWSVQWLDQTTSAEKAGPTGRMRLAQSARKFELDKGAERQLYVFIRGDSGMPPPAEDFAQGTLKLVDGPEITLTHKQEKAQ